MKITLHIFSVSLKIKSSSFIIIMEAEEINIMPIDDMEGPITLDFDKVDEIDTDDHLHRNL